MPNEKVTYIFDNEPRNKEIIKRMYDVIEKIIILLYGQTTYN